VKHTIVLVNPRYGLFANRITSDACQVHEVSDVGHAMLVVTIDSDKVCEGASAFVCPYCGQIYGDANAKCPNCGAPRTSVGGI
jgi:rubrerythrin